jgi:hypothetical protein
MLRVVKLEKQDRHLVYTHNGLELGYFEKEVDGYYGFVPVYVRGAFWSAECLTEIISELNKLNKAWNDQVTKEIGNGR